MLANSTVEITTFSKLKYGDLFIGTKPNGSPFLGMKVGTKQTSDDEPYPDVMVLSHDKAPELFNAGWLSDRPRVARMENLEFSATPQKTTDLILDVQRNSDARGRVGAGCVYLIGDDIYLGVTLKYGGPEQEGTFYVNIKTGDCWHDAYVGTLDMRGRSASRQLNLLNDGAALPRWRIVETKGDRTPWVTYEVPGVSVASAA